MGGLRLTPQAHAYAPAWNMRAWGGVCLREVAVVSTIGRQLQLNRFMNLAAMLTRANMDSAHDSCDAATMAGAPWGRALVYYGVDDRRPAYYVGFRSGGCD